MWKHHVFIVTAPAQGEGRDVTRLLCPEDCLQCEGVERSCLKNKTPAPNSFGLRLWHTNYQSCSRGASSPAGMGACGGWPGALASFQEVALHRAWHTGVQRNYCTVKLTLSTLSPDGCSIQARHSCCPHLIVIPAEAGERS